MVKVKQVNITANYAWSPVEFHPIQIATATAAQQLDATFSTNANLSLYTVDLSDTSKDLTLSGQVRVPNRFYKVIWGHGGLEPTDTDSKGLVVCGADNGLINIYDPRKLINSEDGEAALVSSNTKHTGPVKALDFNPFQKNLYASGASDSEIFIWDLKNPANPMTPGKKTEPSAPISCVAWNRQVQHILGSSTTVTSGPCCVVWDLRKNAPIIKVQDPSGRMQCSEIAWHPEVATQLVLASEDDRSPVVQLWDLRFANSPLRVLENHQRGVLSVAWCQQDPDLLMTCGKDNRVVCWNPNSTQPEILYEVPNTPQWCFDVQWCPRNPAMVSLGSFDGHISIHSLMGGSTYTDMPSKQQQDDLAESFGGSAFASAPVEQPQSPKKIISIPLKKPPKWICRPCGATFSFGGKLVSFESSKPTAGQQEQQQPVMRTVTIHQVVTEIEFISRSEKLQGALSSSQYGDFCQNKMESAENIFEEDLWSFLKAKFDPEPRKQFLHLLGYDSNKIRTKISGLIGTDEEEKLAAKLDDISTSGDSAEMNQSGDGADAFELIAASKSLESIQSTSTTESTTKQLMIPSDDKDPESLISQALLVGDYESAVKLCLRENRMADAIVLAIAGGQQLLERTRRAYFAQCTSKIGRLMLAVATKNYVEIVTSCDLANWKEALATLLTYSNKEEMNVLCDKLGARLEANPDHKIHACLCYVCSGSVEKLVRCWDGVAHVSNKDKAMPDALQARIVPPIVIPLKSAENCGGIVESDLIEKVMILRKAVEDMVGRGVGQAAAEKLANYASILASQGKLEEAMGYLPDSVDRPEIKLLRDRLQCALGFQSQRVQQQNTGYQRVDHSPAHSVQPGYDQRYSQPVQPRQTYQPIQPVLQQNQIPTRSEPVSNNPYAASRRSQPKPGFVAQATPNLYVPQQPIAPTGPPGVVNGFNHGMAQQPTTGVYQPTMAPSSEPTASQQQPTFYTEPLRQANSPTDTTSSNNGGWNDPPNLNPARVPKKKKESSEGVFTRMANYLKPLSPLSKSALDLPFTVDTQTSQDQQAQISTFQPTSYNFMTPAQPVSTPTPWQPMHPNVSVAPVQVPTSNSQYIMQPNGPPGAPAVVAQGFHPDTPVRTVTEESDFSEEPPALAPSVPTAAAKDVPKAPIPPEHQILQMQFESLIKQCLANATSAQAKRKLEDCERRMEFLYDKLRANTLSSNIVAGLHQVAQFIGARDYPSGLRQHTQIVSSSNFSEISAFMPGLKSMLQLAMQLRV